MPKARVTPEIFKTWKEDRRSAWLENKRQWIESIRKDMRAMHHEMESLRVQVHKYDEIHREQLRIARKAEESAKLAALAPKLRCNNVGPFDLKCEFNHGHSGFHHFAMESGSVTWSEQPPMTRCTYTSSYDGQMYRCALDLGHAGIHKQEPTREVRAVPRGSGVPAFKLAPGVPDPCKAICDPAYSSGRLMVCMLAKGHLTNHRTPDRGWWHQDYTVGYAL
jgi:hypothetical protein